MYLRTHVVWNVKTVLTLFNSNSNFLRSRSRGSTITQSTTRLSSTSWFPKFDPITVLFLQIPLLLYRYILPKGIPQKYYKSISSFMIAIHFAFGLALSGMLQPSKVQKFSSPPNVTKL